MPLHTMLLAAAIVLIASGLILWACHCSLRKRPQTVTWIAWGLIEVPLIVMLASQQLYGEDLTMGGFMIGMAFSLVLGLMLLLIQTFQLIAAINGIIIVIAYVLGLFTLVGWVKGLLSSPLQWMWDGAVTLGTSIAIIFLVDELIVGYKEETSPMSEEELPSTGKQSLPDGPVVSQ